MSVYLNAYSALSTLSSSMFLLQNSRSTFLRKYATGSGFIVIIIGIIIPDCDCKQMIPSPTKRGKNGPDLRPHSVVIRTSVWGSWWRWNNIDFPRTCAAAAAAASAAATVPSNPPQLNDKGSRFLSLTTPFATPHLPGDSILLAETFFVDGCGELSVLETWFHWTANGVCWFRGSFLRSAVVFRRCAVDTRQNGTRADTPATSRAAFPTHTHAVAAVHVHDSCAGQASTVILLLLLLLARTRTSRKWERRCVFRSSHSLCVCMYVSSHAFCMAQEIGTLSVARNTSLCWVFQNLPNVPNDLLTNFTTIVHYSIVTRSSPAEEDLIENFPMREVRSGRLQLQCLTISIRYSVV